MNKQTLSIGLAVLGFCSLGLAQASAYPYHHHHHRFYHHHHYYSHRYYRHGVFVYID